MNYKLSNPHFMKRILRRCALVINLLTCHLLICHFLPAQEPDTTAWVVDGKVSTLARSGATAYLGGFFKYIGQLTGGGAMLNLEDGHLTNNRSLKIKGRVMTAVPDGKGGWFIGGDFTEVQGVPRQGLAHINADNSLDGAWNVNVTYMSYPRVYPYITYMTVANNTLYFIGDFQQVNGQDRYMLAAVDAATGEGTGWNPDLVGSVTTLTAKDGLVYAGGSFTTPEGQRSVAALDAVTGKPTAWSLATDGAVHSIAFVRNTMYLAGDFEQVAGVARRRLAAVDLSFNRVTGWNPYMGGYANVLRTRGDTVFVGGWYGDIAGVMRDNLAALDATSGKVLDWNAGDLPLLDQNNFAISDNTIYVSGGFRSGQIINYLAAFDAVTGRQTGWAPGVDGAVFCIAASGKTAFVGGEFNSAGGKFRNNGAAIDLSSGKITEWNPDADSQICKLMSLNGLIYAGGTFTKMGGLPRSGLAALHATTGKPTAWNPDLWMIHDSGFSTNGYVLDMVADNGLLYVGGQFTRVGNEPRKYAAAVELLTGKATPWNPGSDQVVHAVGVFGPLVYLGGEFTTINEKARLGLAAVHKVTGQPTNWHQDLMADYSGWGNMSAGKAYAMKLVNATLYVIGSFTQVGTQARNGLAAINLIDGQITSWATERKSSPFPMAVIDSVLYANCIAGENPDGQAVVAFSRNSGKPVAWNLQPIPAFSANATQVLDADGLVYAEGTTPGIFNHHQPGRVRVFTIYAHSPENNGESLQNLVQGTAFHDKNRNCVIDAGEERLPDVVMVAKPGDYYAISDSLGNYTLAVDTGTYTVRQLLPDDPGRLITPSCPASSGTHTVSFKGYNNTVTGKDFGNQVTLRPYLTASVASTRRRRCFPANTTLTYCNAGSLPVADAKVHLQLPPHVVLVGANASYTVAPDKHLVFDVGTLAPNGCGTIQVTDSVVCDNPDIRGLTQCTKVWITPANAATPAAGWDGSDITLKAKCLTNGWVRLGLYNTGTGAMRDSSAYRIYLDAALALNRNFKLAAGDSLMLQVPANGQTVRLEAGQRPGHPSKQSTNVTLEACGTGAGGKVSLGFVAQLPQDDAEPEVDTECLPITDSFDPNDKLVLPAGVTAEHYTAFGQELEYTVRFQNTGNDYAYRVVLVDTLSENLDVSTLRMNGASHPNKFTVSGKGRPVLTWTFDDIALPDSARDQAGSNGLVKFTIKPLAGLPDKTRIENFADIFFDYNPPVRTNTTLNTLHDLPRETTGGDALPLTVCTPNQPVRAGPGQAFCGNSTTTLRAQAPVHGGGRWKLVGGAGRIARPQDATTGVEALGYGENVFEWSIPDGSCANDSLRARVTVTRYPNPEKPAVAPVGVNGLESTVEGDTYQWLCNGRLLPDHTRSIIAGRGGLYTVRVSGGNGCASAFSDPFDFRLTGPVLDLLSAIYPNPAGRDFTVALPGGLPQVTISLFDAQGKKVAERTTYNAGKEPLRQDFHLPACRAGVYLVKIQTLDALVVKRVVLR